MQQRYNLLVRGLLPVLFLYFFGRSLREPEYRRHWRERLGFIPAPAPGGLWVHAASLGEMQAATPLLRAIAGAHPGLPLHVTCFTPTGRVRAEALALPGMTVSYLPVDTPGAVRRFLNRLRPAALAIVETEFWPNLLAGCAERGIPVLYASARLSANSLASLRRHLDEQLLARAAGAVRWAGTQSAADAQRFHELGVAASSVEITGNLKFDVEAPAAAADARALRAAWGSRPVWIAASTHEGEEDTVLAAHRTLRGTWPNLLLILVPRHPQRFGRVFDLCRKAQLVAARRSVGDKVDPDTDIILADTLGELQMLYAAADVAFVGGSLVPIGGHNLLEPAVLGVPIVTGSHTESQKEVVERLRAEGGVVEIAESDMLADAISRLLQNPAYRRELCAAAAAVLAANRGALSRTLNRLQLLLPPVAS